MVGYSGMRNYQLTLILRPSLSDVQRKKLLEAVKGLLKGAKIIKEDEWGQKPLAYPIKHEVSGFYLNLLLETESVDFKDLEKKLLANDEVLRHLLLRQ